MGWNFRKSIKFGPARINLSKSGIGYSVGAGGLRFTHSPRKRCTSNSTSGILLKLFLYFLAFCAALYLIVEYWYVLLILAVAAALIWGLLRLHAQKAAESGAGKFPADAPEAGSNVGIHAEDTGPQKSGWEIRQGDAAKEHEAIAAAIEERKAAFEAELRDIPKVNVSLADPTPRHRLKDMPEYFFSNVTRSTRLDSIFPLVFLDVETTGLYPSKSEIIEVSAIKFDVGMTPISYFSTLCKPQKPIPEEATAVNHITDSMVDDSPAFSQVAPALNEFIKDCNIAGHNIDFDLRFIFAHGAQFPENVKFYDTLDLAHLTIKRGEISGGYGLESLCFYYGIWRNNSHRSLSDCYAASKVFTHIVQDKTGRDLTKEL